MSLSPRVILIHDWLTGMRGGEKCLEPACQRWPDAEIRTLLHVPGSVSTAIERHPIHPTPLGRLPAVARYYRYLLPLMPFAAGWKLRNCDLVLSFSHCVAKSAQAPPGVPHICYCFTPMRYAWHMRSSYFRRGKLGRLKEASLDLLLGQIRAWDYQTAARVTHFIAISETVRQRIQECYGRESVVIAPPVDTEFYTPDSSPRESFYLVVSAFAPYKRFDLAVEACTHTRRPLIVIGDGQDAERLKSLAGPTVTFLGRQPDEVVRDHYRRCRALLYPGEEDFGIVPLEAHACGAPVIAFGRGGATETVIPHGKENPTGLFFQEQTLDSLIDALDRFESLCGDFDPRVARQRAFPFGRDRYERELFGYVERVLAGEPPLRGNRESSC